MSVVFSKPILVENVLFDTIDSSRPIRTFSAGYAVKGATRHRLDDRKDDGGQVVEQEQIVYLPPYVSIAPGDRVTFDGIEWVVSGEPFRAYSNRSGSIHHLEVRVRAGKR